MLDCSAPSFAALSASSFIDRSTWPGIHVIFVVMCCEWSLCTDSLIFSIVVQWSLSSSGGLHVLSIADVQSTRILICVMSALARLTEVSSADPIPANSPS